MNAVRRYLLALQFFTRIPVTGALARWVGYSPQLLRASAAHFPGVGLIVGMLGALVYAGVAGSLPKTSWTPLVAAVLSTVATVLVTGAFHEDGLADTADGLGGSPLRERALEIMKDSRVGTYGVLAVVLAILTKVALLTLMGGIGLQRVCAALVLAHVASRAWPLLLIRVLPYVGDADVSKSKPLADQISGASLMTALLWLASTLAIVGRWLEVRQCAASLIASALAFLWMWRLLRRRLQGFTGDGLGATQQVCEVACYLGIAFTL